VFTYESWSGTLAKAAPPLYNLSLLALTGILCFQDSQPVLVRPLYFLQGRPGRYPFPLVGLLNVPPPLTRDLMVSDINLFDGHPPFGWILFTVFFPITIRSSVSLSHDHCCASFFSIGKSFFPHWPFFSPFCDPRFSDTHVEKETIGCINSCNPLFD